MPAYNEEENIHNVIKQWYPILEGKSDQSKLVVADSGSTDKTHDILTTLQNTEYPKLVLLSESDKYHGPKLMALYNYAIQNGADYIFQTDSDGQTDPNEFNEFWNLRDKYDGIFGCRKKREDGKFRAFVEKVVCMLLNLYFGVTIPDANAPFRLMKTDIVKKYLYKLESDYNLPNIMITTYFVHYHEKFAFIPISFKPRQGGTNSINLRKIFLIGWRALKDFRKLRQEM